MLRRQYQWIIIIICLQKINNFKIDGSIGVNMSDAVLDSCSKYYNKADEYIGKTAEYVYVQIVVR